MGTTHKFSSALPHYSTYHTAKGLPLSMPPSKNASEPFHLAVCLFPGFQLLDVCGPLDCLNVLQYDHPMKLSVIGPGPTLDPVTTRVPNAPNNLFSEALVTTHTYQDPPSDVDAVFVPGGLGARSPPQEMLDYLKGLDVEKLEYIMTVCTGSAILAMTGLLDGKKATSNKKSFEWVKTQGPKVDWVKRARWVEDPAGKIWTSSGVSAGIDMTLAWIEKTCGAEVATQISNTLEYDWHKDSSWDPYADMYPSSS